MQNYQKKQPRNKPMKSQKLSAENMQELMDAVCKLDDDVTVLDEVLDALLETTADRALFGRLLAFYKLVAQAKQQISLLYFGVRGMEKEHRHDEPRA
jgi:F0F1-type ATP synthase delta subunit